MPAATPVFSYQGIVLAPEKLRYNPCQDVIFPSVIKAEGLVDRALGKYYMYYAPHDAPGGICLAHADALTGPWIEYEKNPIISRQWAPHYEVSHVSSPHAIWVPGAAKFFLLFPWGKRHDPARLFVRRDSFRVRKGGRVDRYVTTDLGIILCARCFPARSRQKKAAYVMLFMGNNEGTRRIYAAWSRDGKYFEAQRTPLISPPPGTDVTQVGAPWYFPWQGLNLVIFHGDKTAARTDADFRELLTTDLYLADVGADFTREDHQGLFFRRQEIPGDKPTGYPIHCLVEEDGRHWLFMAVGQRLKQVIALAGETSAG